MGEFEQIALIEETQLQGTALGQRADLRTLQCRDPGQSLQRAQAVDRLVGDHPPISYQYQALEAKVLAQLLDLIR